MKNKTLNIVQQTYASFLSQNFSFLKVRELKMVVSFLRLRIYF